MASHLSAREYVAALKQEERDAKRRQKEIEKRLKEQAKLDALERAKLEVEEFESRIEVLLSMHKQRTTNADWEKVCATLTSVDPPRLKLHEFRARTKGASPAEINRGIELDDEAHQKARAEAASYDAQIKKLTEIGKGVLAGEKAAYKRALSELGIFNEIGELGSQIHFTIHNAKLIECVLHVIGSTAIPQEIKTLTAAGKVSAKAMPRGRFHEIYQDYVCGCLLRVASEVFALLPVNMILVTAQSEITDASTGVTSAKPVLSVAFDRERFSALNMETLDPSEAVQGFDHRGEFRRSSRDETFTSIEPLNASNFASPLRSADSTLAELQELAANMKNRLQKVSAAAKAEGDVC